MSVDELPDIPGWLPIEKYGIGIPFGLTTLSLGLFYGAAPGMTNFQSISGYAQLGVSVIILGGLVSAVSAGIIWAKMDMTLWLLDKYRDGPPGAGGPSEQAKMSRSSDTDDTDEELETVDDLSDTLDDDSEMDQ